MGTTAFCSGITFRSCKFIPKILCLAPAAVKHSCAMQFSQNQAASSHVKGNQKF